MTQWEKTKLQIAFFMVLGCVANNWAAFYVTNKIEEDLWKLKNDLLTLKTSVSFSERLLKANETGPSKPSEVNPE